VIRFVVSESPSPFAILRQMHGPAASLRNTALCIWSAPTESIFYKPATTTVRWPNKPMKLPCLIAPWPRRWRLRSSGSGDIRQRAGQIALGRMEE